MSCGIHYFFEVILHTARDRASFGRPRRGNLAAGMAAGLRRDHRTTPATQAAHPGQRWAKRDLCVFLPGYNSLSPAITIVPGKEYLMWTAAAVRVAHAARLQRKHSRSLLPSYSCPSPCCSLCGRADRTTFSSWTGYLLGLLRCATAILHGLQTKQPMSSCQVGCCVTGDADELRLMLAGSGISMRPSASRGSPVSKRQPAGMTYT